MQVQILKPLFVEISPEKLHLQNGRSGLALIADHIKPPSVELQIPGSWGLPLTARGQTAQSTHRGVDVDLARQSPHHKPLHVEPIAGEQVTPSEIIAHLQKDGKRRSRIELKPGWLHPEVVSAQGRGTIEENAEKPAPEEMGHGLNP